jgi:hypothetical protein
MSAILSDELSPSAYRIGVSQIASEVPEPMRIVMEENSRALESITNKALYSGTPKPSPNQDC